MYKSIATLGPVGYLPASGTMASLIAIVGVIGFYTLFTDPVIYIPLLIVVGYLCRYILSQALNHVSAVDPSEFVLDEVFGMLLVFLWTPLNPTTLIAGFLLFRFFDITKIAGIRFLEHHIAGATGIMIDDIVAALYAHLILQVLLA